MTHTVIGFFRNSSDAYHAADVLKERGFDNSFIDVSSGSESYDADERREKTGKVGQFFKSLFSDDDDNARHFSEAAKNNSLVTVHARSKDEAEDAADILDEFGAIDVDETEYTGSTAGHMEREDRFTAGKEYDYTSEGTGVGSDIDFDHDRDRTGDFDRTKEERTFISDSDPDRTTGDFDHTDEASIPIIEEEVNIGKREVRRGGVRVRSRIIERPVEETLRLREEHVHVQRNPVDRDASEADLENFQDQTIEVNEYGEEPLVSKRARVVEEVKVGKEVHERKETVRERKRKTEVDVENLDESSERKNSGERKDNDHDERLFDKD